jgi:hypothetical protein
MTFYQLKRAFKKLPQLKLYDERVCDIVNLLNTIKEIFPKGKRKLQGYTTLRMDI